MKYLKDDNDSEGNDVQEQMNQIIYGVRHPNYHNYIEEDQDEEVIEL